MFSCKFGSYSEVTTSIIQATGRHCKNHHFYGTKPIKVTLQTIMITKEGVKLGLYTLQCNSLKQINNLWNDRSKRKYQ